MRDAELVMGVLLLPPSLPLLTGSKLRMSHCVSFTRKVLWIVQVDDKFFDGSAYFNVKVTVDSNRTERGAEMVS